MEIPVGAAHTESVIVDESRLASTIGSGLVDVFATPMLILLMETAAAGCIQKFLPEGGASVGTMIAATHAAATPLGMRVTATATVTAVDRRRVDFEVVARDEKEEIGRGTHSRFIIDAEKFLAKTNAKRGQNA